MLRHTLRRLFPCIFKSGSGGPGPDLSSLVYTGGSGWNAYAVSTQQITGGVAGVLEFKVPAASGTNMLLGLHEDLTGLNPTATYGVIDYGIHIRTTNGVATVFENGSQVYVDTGVPLVSATVWTVESDGTTVVYKRDGTTMYTSAQAVGGRNLKPMAASDAAAQTTVNNYASIDGVAVNWSTLVNMTAQAAS